MNIPVRFASDFSGCGDGRELGEVVSLVSDHRPDDADEVTSPSSPRVPLCKKPGEGSGELRFQPPELTIDIGDINPDAGGQEHECGGRAIDMR